MPKSGSTSPPSGRKTTTRASRSARQIGAETSEARIEDIRPGAMAQNRPGGLAYAPAKLAQASDDFAYDDDDDESGPDPLYAGSAEETARYISDMVGSLALMAREARLDLLTYLLDMARVEAEMQARQTETPFDDD